MMRCNTLLATLLLALSAPAFAQSDDQDTIQTERPGFTAGTSIVPKGMLQVEFGYRFTKVEDQKEHDIGDAALLRIPVHARAEVRFGLPSYLLLRGDAAGRAAEGLADASVSAKWRFLDEERGRPALAVIAGATLPSGDDAVGGVNTLQPSVALELDKSLSDRWSLTADAVYSAPVTESGREDEWAGAVSLTYSFTRRTSAFLETYRISGTGNQHYVDGGVTHLLNPNTQFDVNGGAGLNGLRGDYFLSAGLAHRW